MIRNHRTVYLLPVFCLLAAGHFGSSRHAHAQDPNCGGPKNAAHEDWYISSEDIKLGSRTYSKYGLPGVKWEGKDVTPFLGTPREYRGVRIHIKPAGDNKTLPRSIYIPAYHFFSSQCTFQEYRDESAPPDPPEKTVVCWDGQAVSASCPPESEQRRKQAGKAYLRALDLTNQQGAAASIPAYREAVALDPENADYRAQLGATLLSTNQHAAAILEYEQAVALAPAKPLHRMGLAQALANVGRTNEALAAIDGASLPPEALTGWRELTLGRALLVKQDYAAAVPHLQKAVDIRGADPDLLLDLAEALAATGQKAAATAASDKALARNPTSRKIRDRRDKILAN